MTCDNDLRAALAVRQCGRMPELLAGLQHASYAVLACHALLPLVHSPPDPPDLRD